MRFFLRMLGVLFLSICLVIAHIAVASSFGTPWNAINSIMGVCLSILVREEKGWVVWVSFVCHALIELYTKTPFGVLLLAGTCSLLFGYWIYSYIFTNQTWYSTLALSGIVMVMYRVLYTGSIVVATFAAGETFVFSTTILLTYVTELVFTTVMVLFTSLVFTKRTPRVSKDRYSVFGYGSSR